MVAENFKQALRTIYNKLENTKIRWAVIGSTNMALQGMDVKPNDLDVIVSLNDMKKIPEIFSEYSPSIIKKLEENTPVCEVKLDIKGVEIEILGERKIGDYARSLSPSKLVYKKLDNVMVPCLKLEEEAKAYSEMNREDKARLIKEFLKSPK